VFNGCDDAELDSYYGYGYDSSSPAPVRTSRPASVDRSVPLPARTPLPTRAPTSRTD
jgi:hypothetical protein